MLYSCRLSGMMRTLQVLLKVYEYNSALQPLYRTLVNGWAEYEYKLNPANVNPKYYEGLGFIEQTATTTTRAVEIGLPFV